MNKNVNKVSVKHLQKLGPEEFRNSNRQEDSQEYFLKLFELVEKDLSKTQNGLAQFNSIFKSEFVVKIKCNNCKEQRELKDHEFNFISTFSNNQNISLNTSEKLDDNYKC